MAPLGTYTNRASLFGPKIIFPWTPTSWRETLEQEGNAITAFSGCRITVALVKSAPIETGLGDFETPEGRERRLVYLYVGTPNGQLQLVERPLVLIAQTATAIQIDQENDEAAFRGLVSKLEQAVGLDDLEEMLQEPIDNWRKPPFKPPAAYGRAFLALHRAVTGDEHAYVSFGYMMARAEAEAHMLEPASRDHRAAIGRAKGGEMRRAKSQSDTEPLRLYATQIINTERDISLTGCAKRVSAIVAQDENWPFSADPKWIGSHIKCLFELRNVEGRTEYRPKRQNP